jgi:hypothetical protein
MDHTLDAAALHAILSHLEPRSLCSCSLASSTLATVVNANSLWQPLLQQDFGLYVQVGVNACVKSHVQAHDGGRHELLGWLPLHMPVPAGNLALTHSCMRAPGSIHKHLMVHITAS